jgi:HAD superfamily hydrolase (TIGR01490 family)
VLDLRWIGKLHPNYGRNMLKLAIYDMDKTITRKASFGPLLAHVLKRRPWRAVMLPLVGLASLGFALGLLNRKRLKEINLALIAGRHFNPRTLGEAFGAETLATNILPSARRQIEADRAEGCRLIMATASYEFYVAVIARNLGFDAVIATRSMDGDPTRINGENCYGASKRSMVEAWMRQQGIAREEAHIRVYSDHVSDAPLFEMANQPVAVNAHAPLDRLAKSQNWECRDWR